MGRGEFRGIYWNNADAASTLEAQFAIVSFPGARASAIGQRGITNYKTSGMVISKYVIRSSDCDDINGEPTNCIRGPRGKVTIGLQSSAFGRGVGNNISDEDGRCADAQQGAISGNNISSDRISGYKIFGNEIYDYGCRGTSKFHHTTYLSIRDQQDGVFVPWEFGWNYLHGNKAKNGIHNFDEDLRKESNCGDLNGVLKIHDNVIVDQAGAGITIISNCGWTNDTEIYGNVLVNVGLASEWDGTDIQTSNSPNTAAISMGGHEYYGQVRVYDNIIYKWNTDGLEKAARSCIGVYGRGEIASFKWNDNICYTNQDLPFEGFAYQAGPKLQKIEGDSNVFYYSGENPQNAISPTWDVNVMTNDPNLLIEGHYFRKK